MMKHADKIKKLKEGYYIKWQEISYTRRIFMYAPDDDQHFVAVLNIKELESLINKGIVKLYSRDTESMIHPNRTIQRDIRIYVYNKESEIKNNEIYNETSGYCGLAK